LYEDNKTKGSETIKKGGDLTQFKTQALNSILLPLLLVKVLSPREEMSLYGTRKYSQYDAPSHINTSFIGLRLISI